MKENCLQFELRREQARDPLLEKRGSFGPGDSNHIDDGSINAWLGIRPVVYNIRKLLKLNKSTRPESFRLMEHHDIWLVYYAFGIAQTSNFRDVVRARLEVQYGSDPLVTIHEVFPRTEFTHWGETEGYFRARFQLSEDTEPKEENRSAEITTLPAALPTGTAAIEAGAKVSLSLNLKVATPFITAAGINNDYGLWELRRHDVPLVGDHQVGHVLLVRRPVIETVTAKLRLSLDVGTFSFLTSPRLTAWVPVKIESPS
jgi:hypothetical protein